MLIDITRLVSHRLVGRLPTGVDRVSLEYLQRFAQRAHALVRVAGRWVVLPRKASLAVFEVLLSNGGGGKVALILRVLAAYLFSWGKVGRTGQVLLNTGHSGLHDPGYARWLCNENVRPVYFLHDLIPITHPEYCRPGEADRHRIRIDTMLSTGRGLIANSAATLSDLEDYAARHGLKLPPRTVALLAPAPMAAPGDSPPFGRPYFVMLGTIEPRKNHLLVLNVWRSLVRDFGEAAPHLVVIGQRGWENEQIVDMLERCEALRGQVFEVPRCSDAQLASWMKHAQALLFPSFAEGYGMPLVEAMALGLPVIASDLPAFREFARDIPEYLDPLDGLGWRETILAYADTSHPMRRAQLERLRSYRAPTWEAHFSAVEALLARVEKDAEISRA